MTVNTEFNPAVLKPALQTAAQRQLVPGILNSITEYTPIEMVGLDANLKIEITTEGTLKITDSDNEERGHYPLNEDNSLGDFVAYS